MKNSAVRTEKLRKRIAQGTYTTGRRCIRGHRSRRYKSGKCIKCEQIRGAKNKAEYRRRIALNAGTAFDPRRIWVEGNCDICGRPAKGKCLAQDHCHATGKMRGFLCHNCNLALGLVHDDAQVLRKAAEYLEHWKHKIIAETHI